MSEIMSNIQDEIYLPLLDELVEEALSDYSPELKYHVRSHGEGVIERVIENRRILIESGVENVPSLYTIAQAAASHDSGYYRYFTDESITKAFSSPEAYAVYLDDERQKARGVDEDTRKEVSDYIIGTKVGVRCRSWGQFILCEADLHTTTLEDRTQMKQDTEALRQEHADLKKDVGEISFKVLSLGILATYNQINFGFPNIGDAGDVFIKRRNQMRTNIMDMSQDIVDQTGEELKDLISRISPPFLGPVLRLFGIKRDAEATDESN